MFENIKVFINKVSDIIFSTDNPNNTEQMSDISEISAFISNDSNTNPLGDEFTTVDNEISFEEYNANENIQDIRKTADTKQIAADFYDIADNNSGISSVKEMQTLFDKNIDSSNITKFLNDYDNVKQGDSSIIDTIISETGASSDVQKKMLNSLIDNLCDAAKKAGVTEEDINKTKTDFKNSMNTEFSAGFRRINPKDMEKSVDFLRGAIAVKENSGKDISESDAISKFNASFKNQNDTAQKDFTEAREKEGWTAKAGDTVLGWFGCNTVQDLQNKLGSNAQNVEKLANAKSETEFKQNYKEIFGVEFDKDKISARENALEKYNIVKNCDTTIKATDELLNSSNSSFTELKSELQNKFNYDEATINQILESYAKNTGDVNPDENKKKEFLLKFLSDTKENLSGQIKTASNGKTLEELAKDLDLITKSTFGTSDIAKDVAQFNENQVLTGVAVEAGAEIAGTIALQLVPGLGQAAAARLAVSAGKWGAAGLRIAGTATKTEKALGAVTNLQQGKVMADTAGKTASLINNGMKVASSMAAAGTATMAVDLSNNRSVEEASKKALMNMSFAGLGTASNTLAPKLMETFGIADSKIASEIAEQVINTAGVYGITKFEGIDYGKEQALIDFTAGLVLSRLGHLSTNNQNKIDQSKALEPEQSLKTYNSQNHETAQSSLSTSNLNQTQNEPFKFDLQLFAGEAKEAVMSKQEFLDAMQKLKSEGKEIRDFDYEISKFHEEDYEEILNRFSAMKDLLPDSTSMSALKYKLDPYHMSTEKFDQLIDKAKKLKSVMSEDTSFQKLMNTAEAVDSVEKLMADVESLKQISSQDTTVDDLIWAARSIEKDTDVTIKETTALKDIVPKDKDLKEIIDISNMIKSEEFDDMVMKISALNEFTDSQTFFPHVIQAAESMDTETFDETIKKISSLNKIMPKDTEFNDLIKTSNLISNDGFEETIKKIADVKQLAKGRTSFEELINISQSIETNKFEETIKKISILNEIAPKKTSFEEIVEIAKGSDSVKYAKEKNLLELGFNKNEREMLLNIDENLYPKAKELSDKLTTEQLIEVLEQNKSDDVINSYIVKNRQDAIAKLDNVRFYRGENEALENFKSYISGENNKLNTDTMDIDSKIKLKSMLMTIQASNILSEKEKEFLQIKNIMNDINHSLDYTITPTAVSKEQSVSMMKGFFANNNEKLENLLNTTDLSQYEKNGIPLEYQRSEYMSDLNSILKNLPDDKKTEILNKLQIKLNSSQGYDGIINLNKLNQHEEVEKKIFDISNRFIKKNSVNVSDTELKNAINSLIKGMPEFINIAGKEQIDVNTLKILQNALNNPEYKNLSNIDKTCLKFTILLNDIAKQEGVSTNAELSAKYAKDILQKYNLPPNVKDRIIELVENQNLLTDFKENNITLTTAATKLRRNGDLNISKIMIEATGKSVSNSDIKSISDAISKMNEKGQIIFSNKIINPDRIPTVEYNGKEYKVINLPEMPYLSDMKKFGFAPGIMRDDLRFNVHMVSSFNDLEKVMRLTESPNKGLLSTSYISYKKKPTYDRNMFGVSVESDNVNIASALHANQNSGFGKNFEAFDNILHENITEKRILEARNKIPNRLKHELGLSDNEYSELYSKIQNLEHLSQFDNIEDITIGNRTFKGSELKNAIKQVSDDILGDPDSFEGLKNSEMLVYAPRINGIVAKVDKMEQIPPKILAFAEEHDLPIYILGADSDVREQLLYGTNFKN